MKQLTKTRKIIIVIIALIIIAGAIIAATIGFNVEFKFQDNKKIELYLEKDFEVSDIEQITNEVLEGQEVLIQKVEVYEDMVSITAKDITDENKEQIITKVNEKYGTALTKDGVTVVSVPRLRLRDMASKYIMPFGIATLIILVYMTARYFKTGILKMLGTTIFTLIITQLILFGIIAITRIPVGRLTIPMIITVFILTLVGLTTKYETKLEKIKEEKKKGN